MSAELERENEERKAEVTRLRRMLHGMGERMSSMNRECAMHRNVVFQDDAKVIELARRMARGPVTAEMVEAWYSTTEHQQNTDLHPEHDTNWEGLWEWHRDVIVAAAMHFGNV